MDLNLDIGTTRSVLSHVSGKLKDATTSTYDAEQIWKEVVNDGQINLELSPGCDPMKELESSRAVLRRSQTMLKVLSGLRKALVNRKDALDCALARTAMQHGLEKLPDKILGTVLSLVDNDFQTVVSLSSVCKRFRRVMLATPKVWANCIVSPDLDPKFSKIIIERSGRLPLICETSNLLFSENADHAQDAILAHRTWSLSLLYDHLTSVKDMPSEFRCLELPSLSHLTIRPFSRMRGVPSTPAYDVWKTPKLQSLKCGNHIPSPPIGAKLTTCCLEFSFGYFDLGKLVRFLSSSRQLRDLSLMFNSITSRNVIKRIIEEDEPSLLLHHGLRLLQIESIGYVPPDLFQELALSMQFPGLTDLRLIYTFNDKNAPTEERNANIEMEYTLLQSLLPIGPFVKNVFITLSGCIRVKNYFGFDFESLLVFVPKSVECISLTAPWNQIKMLRSTRLAVEDYIYPTHLRRLHFYKCDMMSVTFLEELQRDLVRHGVQVPEVKVEQCARITKKDLKSIFPKSEIIYKPTQSPPSTRLEVNMDLNLDTTRTMIMYVNDKLKSVTASTYNTKQIWEEFDMDKHLGAGLSFGCNPIQALEIPRSIFRRCDSIFEILSGLEESLFLQIRALECALTRVSMRHGFDKIPDEILAIILGLVDEDIYKTVQLSHVCNRFREVMLANPRVWANCLISPQLRTTGIKMIVERSQGSLLRCELKTIRTGFGNNQLDMIFNLKQVKRIGSLSIKWLEALQISSKYNIKEFPSLRHLDIADSFSQIPESREIPWKMPELQHLTCQNYIPFSMSAAKLMICNMEFVRKMVDLPRLVGFLSSSNHLHTLFLRFEDIRGENLVEIVMRGLPIVHQGLRLLQIESSGHTTSALFKQLALSLKFPKLTDLKLSHNPEVTNQTDQENETIYEIEFNLLKSLLPIGPAVNNVSISLSGPRDISSSENNDLIGLDFGHILCLAPKSMRTISLTAPRHQITMDWPTLNGEEYKPHTCLRSISFCNCDMMHANFLEKLQEDLVRYRVPVPAMRIEQCAQITKRDLEAAFPNSKTIHEN